MIKLISEQDTSKNYIQEVSDGGFFESRYVQRDPSYLIVYLSSHSGCNQACRFCHLTQSAQTMMSDATLEDFIAQAKRVIEDVDIQAKKEEGLVRIKYNFMARGEPLLNNTILNNWKTLWEELLNIIPEDIKVDFSISTIIPSSFNKKLEDIFITPDVSLYYSIYSIEKSFRKKWLPKAKPVKEATQLLKEYFLKTGNTVKFHSAFIKEQNDSVESVLNLKYFLKENFKPSFKFNIVRYNPYSPKQGVEALFSDIYRNALLLDAKIVGRVGFDVKASCGMFYSTKGN